MLHSTHALCFPEVDVLVWSRQNGFSVTKGFSLIFEFPLVLSGRPQRLFVWYMIHVKWDITYCSLNSSQAFLELPLSYLKHMRLSFFDKEREWRNIYFLQTFTSTPQACLILTHFWQSLIIQLGTHLTSRIHQLNEVQIMSLVLKGSVSVELTWWILSL